MRTLRVTIDQQTCVANQACVTSAPGVFRLNDSGTSEVVDISAGTEDQIVEAAWNCPVGAISVVDADTGEDVVS
jgi:ferredoxin